jgi:hypothetical protein
MTDSRHRAVVQAQAAEGAAWLIGQILAQQGAAGADLYGFHVDVNGYETKVSLHANGAAAAFTLADTLGLKGAGSVVRGDREHHTYSGMVGSVTVDVTYLTLTVVAS